MACYPKADPDVIRESRAPEGTNDPKLDRNRGGFVILHFEELDGSMGIRFKRVSVLQTEFRRECVREGTHSLQTTRMTSFDLSSVKHHVIDLPLRKFKLIRTLINTGGMVVFFVCIAMPSLALLPILPGLFIHEGFFAMWWSPLYWEIGSGAVVCMVGVLSAQAYCVFIETEIRNVIRGERKDESGVSPESVHVFKSRKWRAVQKTLVDGVLTEHKEKYVDRPYGKTCGRCGAKVHVLSSAQESCPYCGAIWGGLKYKDPGEE